MSLRTRLIVAFLAVAALPMVIATWFAAALVADAFEDNIRHWLGETSTFFLRIVDTRRRDATAAAEFLLADRSLLDQMTTGAKSLPRNDAALLELAGLDLLAVVDADGAIVFSNRPSLKFVSSEATGNPYLFDIEAGGRRYNMVGGVVPFEAHGVQYRMLLGDWLDRDFIDESELVTSLTLRMFYLREGQFRQVYSTHGDADAGGILPAAVVEDLRRPALQTFVHETERGDFRALYTAIRGPDGSLIGVLFCGLSSKGSLNGLITQRRLFGAVFGIGSLLSIIAALWLSRRLLVPLRALSAGVKAISAGDYGRSVQVARNDEFGELAARFNAMSRQLERMQEIEQQLRRQERLGALGEMALGLAHEVRNPLGIIQTSAQLLQRQAQLQEGDKKLLGYVISEVRRIDVLIAEFMDFANPGPDHLQSIIPSEAIARVCSFCAPEFEQRGIQCELVDEIAGIEVLGDAAQVYQVLLNLVLNAIEAMPDGGILKIRAWRHAKGLIIEVADSGPGVPAELRERIFNPFFTTKTKGSGLGLPKVYAVMERHGGTVEYVERARAGAVFRLQFPLSPLVSGLSSSSARP